MKQLDVGFRRDITERQLTLAYVTLAFDIVKVLLLVGFATAYLLGCTPVKETTWLNSESPKRAGWSAPLSVTTSNDVDQDELSVSVKFWNKQIGCPLLRIAEEGGDILLEHGNPTVSGEEVSHCSGKHVACTFLLIKGSRVQAPIFLIEPQGRGVDSWIWSHELGHALGLGHDIGRKLSVMRPDAPNPFGRVEIMLVTDADRRAIRSRWCPNEA